MAMIFGFSAEDSNKSSDTSSEVIEDVLDIVLPKEEITPSVVKKYQFPFRKAAHFGIFMLLGFALANAFNITISKKWYFSYPSAIAVSILYAISDEIHQKFSDGRVPSFRDVMIDSLGAVMGVLIFVAFITLYSYFSSKSNINKKPIKK